MTHPKIIFQVCLCSQSVYVFFVFLFRIPYVVLETIPPLKGNQLEEKNQFEKEKISEIHHENSKKKTDEGDYRKLANFVFSRGAIELTGLRQLDLPFEIFKEKVIYSRFKVGHR